MKAAAIALACLIDLSCLAQPTGSGSALSFDGTGGYVSIATTGSLSGTFTVELWAKPYDNGPNAALGLVGSRRPVDFGFDFIFWQGNMLHGDLGNASIWITTAADAPFAYLTNNWYHLAEVVTPTDYTIYVDGSPLATGSYSLDSPLLYDGDHKLVIGSFAIDLPGLSGEYMNGQIDEVRIWSTARTASQLQTNAFRALTGTEPGLMGYWRFDEGSGSTIADASGHGFTGTIISSSITGPTWVASKYPNEKLLIVQQPQSQTVPAGSDLTLSVGVFGAEPVSYQWRFNLTDLPGATDATLNLQGVDSSTSGLYFVLVSNQAGPILSQPALISVVAQPCPPGYYSANGLQPCIPAPPGYYVPTTGATNLIPASPGYYVPGFAATNQVPASLGTYVPFSGMSSNIPAPPGYFVPSPGSTEATPASPGYSVPILGASFQIQARPGEWAPISGMARPLPAYPGYYVPAFGSIEMTPAPAGSYVEGVGAPWYHTPLAGQYAPVAGMSATIAAGDLDGDGSVTQFELNAALTNYWSSSPWLSMTNFGEQCGGEFQFALTNASAWNFSVLYSTNLAATNWDYLGVAYPVYRFADPAVTNGAPQRFYRLRWP